MIISEKKNFRLAEYTVWIMFCDDQNAVYLYEIPVILKPVLNLI